MKLARILHAFEPLRWRELGQAMGAHSDTWIWSYNCRSSDLAAQRLLQFNPQHHHVPSNSADSFKFCKILETRLQSVFPDFVFLQIYYSKREVFVLSLKHRHIVFMSKGLHRHNRTPSSAVLVNFHCAAMETIFQEAVIDSPKCVLPTCLCFNYVLIFIIFTIFNIIFV